MPENPEQPAGRKREPSLDDLIDRADRHSLDAAASRDEAARRHIEVQDRIDDSLRRAFEEPERVHFVAAGTSQRPSWLKWAPLAAAAAVLLAAVIGWRMWTVAKRPDILGPLYHQIVDAGFRPDQVCTTDEQFAGWTRQYLREGLAPSTHPQGLEYVGWSTGRAMGNISAILLARVDGEPVIVVMERTDRVHTYPGGLKDDDLHLYRKRVGEVVMYEVSPFTQQRILPVIVAKPDVR